MGRIDLEVPFSQKDDAKRLGAKWDAVLKTWFIPEGKDIHPFTAWLPKEREITIRSSTYCIMESSSHCWKCGEGIRVYGFFLPPGHELFEVWEYDGTDKYGEWEIHDKPTMVSYVKDISPFIVNRIKSYSNHYRVDYSKTVKADYWMNHCEHCGMKQGDFMLYDEPCGAFYPIDERMAANITLHPINEPFGSNGHIIYGEMFSRYFKINV